MDFTHMTTKKIKTASKLRAIIKDIKKSVVVATGEKFIDVTVWIYENDKKVDVKKFGYSYGTSEKEIISDVKKHLKLRESEKTQIKKQVALDEEESAEDKKVEKLKNIEIK